MDPLSVAASITGLLAAAGQIAKMLSPYVSAAKETPQITALVYAEVQSANIILSALQNLTKKIHSCPARYGDLIQVDQIVAVLTDGVLVFSELEATLGSVEPGGSAGQRLPLRSRLNWARKESTFVALLTRLQGFKGSISLMLMILKSDSDQLAMQHRDELSVKVNVLLESNHALSRRLMNLEDAFDVQTIVSRRQSIVSVNRATHSSDQTRSINQQDSNYNASRISPSEVVPEAAGISGFDFEDDLEASRAYRRAQRNTMDFSFRSSVARTNAWSMFSGLSLSDISIMSVIALPVYKEDITNTQHYDFGAGSLSSNTAAPPQPDHRERPILYGCLEIQLQLTQIPGFFDIFKEEESNEDEFMILWQVFKKGFPLLMLLNAFGDRWDVSQFRDKSPAHGGAAAQRAVYTFLQACPDVLGLQVSDLFTMSDLMGGYYSGFLKVITIISSILSNLTELGNIAAVDIGSLLPVRGLHGQNESQMDVVVEEFVMDQRSYVRQLEELASIKSQLELSGDLSGDDIHTIFGVALPMVDFHIRLVIAMEKNLLKLAQDQQWETVFLWYCESSPVEGVFISSEKRAKSAIRLCLETRKQNERDRLMPLMTLCLGLLSCTSQRVPKYATFLQTLRSQDGLSEGQQEDLRMAWYSFQEAQVKINEVIKKEEIREAVSDLERRVVDWKGHDLKAFGQLLLFDSLNVTRPKYKPNKYHVYLFEAILLCCLERPDQAPRNRLFRRAKPAQPNSNAQFLLKGRIFGCNMRNVVTESRPGSYKCQIHWRSDSLLIEQFTLEFSTASQLNMWVQKLREVKIANQPLEPNAPNFTRTTQNFTWTAQATSSSRLDNPYLEDEGDDDDDDESKVVDVGGI